MPLGWPHRNLQIFGAFANLQKKSNY